MPTRSTNTMVEGLQKLLGSITELKMTPDADLQFLVDLETRVLGYVRSKAQSVGQPPPVPMGMPGMGSSPMPGGGPSPVRGLNRVTPAVPADELRRMVNPTR